MILKDKPWMPDVRFLEYGARVSKAVARLQVHSGGLGTLGTAFLVAHDLALTAAHVLPDSPRTRAATTATLVFDYAWHDVRTPLAKIERECDIGDAIVDAEHDWALLSLAQAMPRTFPTIGLFNSRPLTPGDRLVVVQHPFGGRKVVAFPHGGVQQVDDRLVHYLTDTAPGAAGAPVFDEDWGLAAIHLGWQEIRSAGGQSERANYGVRAERIRQHLVQLGVQIGSSSTSELDPVANLLYICFHPNDHAIVDNLELHLAPLVAASRLTVWHSGKVAPGGSPSEERAVQRNAARVALIVVSPDLLAAPELMKETEGLLEDAARGRIKAIPLLARACMWDLSPLSKLQPLPRSGRPLAQALDAEQEYVDVSRAIGATMADGGF